MTYESITPNIGAQSLYTALFEAMPGNSVLVKNDPPKFTILAATPAYLEQTGYTKEAITGKGMLEAFPLHTDIAYMGGRDLLSSCLHVSQNKEPHYLPLQCYDLKNDGGGFTEKYWRVSNKPILNPHGEVIYIVHAAEDITAQVKAEEREVQLDGIKKAFSLFMHAPMVVSLVNGDTYVLELANHEAFKLWGKGTEIIGRPILEALPELGAQGIIEHFNRVRTSGEPFLAREVPVNSFVDGKAVQHYFNLVYQPYYNNGSSKATGVFTIAYNVTEQVQARLRAEESEAKFRTMAESTPVLIAVGDENGNITYYNKAWTDLTGKPTQELLQSSWVDLIYPEDRERFVAIFLEAFATKGPFTGEFRVSDSKGDFRWLLAHGVPRYTADGNFVGYISACTNITEHKKVQHQLQTALEQVRLSKEAAELGTFDLDLEKGTMHWDDRCRTLFGISHHNPVRYETDFAEGLHPDDRERILKVIDRLYIKAVSNGDYDVEYRTVGAEDSIVRWVRAKGKVYFNEQEKPVRFIGSVLDITEKVSAIQKIEDLVEKRTKELAQANETLQSINKELQRSNQNLEEFAHAASHDLKEPVRKIHFFTSQLKEQLNAQLQEGQARAFSRIENATERMGNLIDDLLLYSHVSQRPHETESIDLNKKVQRVLEDLELDIEEKKAVIHVEELPTVNGYRRQLQQLFQNLISNALKYSKKDVPPQISIRAVAITENGKPYHLISIKDNGIGFDTAYADKIFQMFTRLHSKTEYSGTGVGLSIVKKVVENHNGYIKAESAPGKGSTFRVYLPAE